MIKLISLFLYNIKLCLKDKFSLILVQKLICVDMFIYFKVILNYQDNRLLQFDTRIHKCSC